MNEVENIDYLNEYLVRAFNIAIVEYDITNVKVEIDSNFDSHIIGNYAKELLTIYHDELQKDYTNNLPTLVNVAEIFYKMAVNQRKIYIQLIHDEGKDSLTDFDIETYQDFAISEIGRSLLLTQFMITAVDLKYFQKLIERLDFAFYPNDIIKINSILWFKELITYFKKHKKIKITLLDEAYKALFTIASYDEFTSGQTFQRKNQARIAIAAKLKKDPKQIALKEIENEYFSSKYPFTKRGYRAKFCKEMIKKYSIIEDIKTVERLFDRLNKSILN